MVSLDMAALRSVAREREIGLDVLVDALESALLSAYRHAPLSMPHARVAIDRASGFGFGEGSGPCRGYNRDGRRR